MSDSGRSERRDMNWTSTANRLSVLDRQGRWRKMLPSLVEELIHHRVILVRRRLLDLVEKDLVLRVGIQVPVRREMVARDA